MKFVTVTAGVFSILLSGAVHADAALGESTYAAKGCIGCHGVGGQSNIPTNPTLKGRDGAFIQKNLTEFRSGARKNAVMNLMTATLTDADIKNLADYIDSLK